MKLLHLGGGPDILSGFDNLDPRINGWTFESGLPYADESVDGITTSHALQNVAQRDWLHVCREFYRVLVPGGVVRITDDDTETPTSPRHHNPWPGVKMLTGPSITRKYLTDAGFRVYDCEAQETHFQDSSLLIFGREHKQPRYVYYIEGKR